MDNAVLNNAMNSLMASFGFGEQKSETSLIDLLPHNIEMYDNIIDKMNQGYHKIFYSEATGLGKSYIFMKLMETHFRDKRVLYVVPKIAIWENLQTYSGFDKACREVNMTTYAAFNNESIVDELAAEYGVIFVDEAHHIESDIQGKNVAKLIDIISSKGGYAFGMTATPLVKGIFIDEVYFDTAVYGNNLADAISKGLFPKIRYELGVPEIIDVPDDYKLSFNVDSTRPMLEQVLEEYKDLNHWLAFFTTIDELEENEAQIKKLFPNFKIFKLYSASGQTEGTLREYNNYEGKSILMSVSMLLEGVHLNYCEGVLLYRNVVTNNTMLQIIGRLCKANNEQSPVFIDITNSIMGISNIFESVKSARDTFNHVTIDIRNEASRKEVLWCSQLTTQTFNLLEKLSETVVHEYRDIKWTSLISLSLALGKQSQYVATQLRYYPEKTEKNIIDECLGKFSYAAYVQNNYSNKEIVEYKGVVWREQSDIADALQVDVRWIQQYLRRHPGKTEKDFIDMKLGIGDLEAYIANGYQTVQSINRYRDIEWITIADLCRKLGRADGYFSSLRSRNPSLTVQEVVDQLLKDSTFMEYVANGFVGKYKCLDYEFVDYNDLAEQLNCSVSTLAHRRRRYNDSLEEAIRAISEEQKKVKVYKGFNCVQLQVLDKQIGKSSGMRRRFFQKCPEKTLCDYIDYCIGDAEDLTEYLRYGSKELHKYKDVVWTDIANLADQYGINRAVIYNYLRKGNSLHDFVDMTSADLSFFKKGVLRESGIVYTTKAQLSVKLGWTADYLSTKINRGTAVEIIVRDRLQKISQETGVPFSNLDELATYFNTTVDDINNWLDESKASIKDYIQVQLNKEED